MNKNQNDFELFRLRSTGAIIRDGYRLYMDSFRRIFRCSWLVALVYAISYGVMTTFVLDEMIGNPKLSLLVAAVSLLVGSLLTGTGMSLLYEHRQSGSIPTSQHWYGFFDKKTMLRTFAMTISFFVVLLLYLFLAVFVGTRLAVSLSRIATLVVVFLMAFIPVLCVPSVLMYMYDFIISPSSKNPFSGRFPLRYWGGAFIIFIVVTIVCLLMVTITQLPANILMIANIRSRAGILIGDPTGMPDYMTELKLIVFTLAGFIQAFVTLSSLFPFYYLYGSVQAQEQERADMKQKMNGQQSSFSQQQDYIEYE